MTLKGYYLETIYPRFKVYRIIVINFINELETYTTAINWNDDKTMEERYPGYINLGGIV